ncbi:hypothetical protein [Calothrix sp. NIES-2098]|uniref:hypothetical protein n=1 Tax=Calothrix sp. NIES-2098 TaxID=1954171 RepID=UPI000B5FB1C7|nr:hypothetical protein NIES2098_42030 [Calothrix sp. NIES-2098]
MSGTRALFWNNGNMICKIYNLEPLPRIGEKVTLDEGTFLVKDLRYQYIGYDSESSSSGQIDINILLEQSSVDW